MFLVKTEIGVNFFFFFLGGGGGGGGGGGLLLDLNKSSWIIWVVLKRNDR